MLSIKKSRKPRRILANRPGYRPGLESCERRELLTTTAVPFLQGTAFVDSNSDGVRATTEVGLPGATVTLYPQTGPTTPATALASTTTDAGGNYSFSGSSLLTPGTTYRLVESAVGDSNTGASAQSDIDPATVTAPNTIQVTVADPNTVQASFVNPIGYGNPPYNVLNYTVNGANGQAAPTQLTFALGGSTGASTAPFTSMCVGALDPLSFNTPYSTIVDSQAALNNGGRIGYLFNHYGSTLPNSASLPSGLGATSTKNIVSGVQLAIWELEYGTGFALTGYVPSYTSPQDYADLQTAASIFLADSAGKSEDVAILDASLTGKLPSPSVSPYGQSVLARESLNFGNAPLPAGVLKGFVYADANNNGTKDTGEAGIGGVTVNLNGVINGVPTAFASTMTAADGSYSFAGLPAGTYTVTEGGLSVYQPDVTNTGKLAGIALAQGATSLNNNFGEILPGSISGVVFADKTGDGLTPDDTPLAGVTVQLVNPSTSAVIASQVVGSNGAYSFNGLAAGPYLVKELVPAGYVQTGPTSITYTVPLAQGQVVTNDNFDNYQTTCCCSIGGVSYTIVGPCGTKTVSSLGGNAGEGDQVTVNFTVSGTMPETVTLVSYVATANMDLTKQTIFSQDTETLAPGPHSLTVSVPNSYYQVDFVCGGAIAQFNPSANITYHGEGRFIDSDNGGCEVAPASFASLSGTVFLDNNDDGKIETGDTGLGGVAVQLTGTDVNGQSVTINRVTAADGTYSFKGLQPGTYKVGETTPTGYVTTKDSVGTVNGSTVGSLTGADQIGGIALAGGNNGVQYNFGEQVASTPLGCNQTASICFWNGCSGQALINSLNGSSSSTKLGNWLASTLPNLFGGLAGKTNAQVASYYQTAYAQWYSAINAEVMATALAAYATDSSLAGGNYACSQGFSVTAGGAGAATINVGNTFACYGGPTGCVTIDQLLKYADSQANSCNDWLLFAIGYTLNTINSCGHC